MGIDRREFLGTAIGAGLGAAIAAGGASSAFAARQGFRLEEATVTGLQEAMRSGEMTSRQLVQAYLRRAATVDKQVNSMIELNPDALQIADQMDRERKSGKVRGPLHGVPVVLKDNIDTADKMKTTARLALPNAPTPKKDAFIAARLLRGGAVILGKTNLSEWANFRDNDSISAGAAAADRRVIHTYSTAIRAVPRRAREQRSRPILRRPRSEPRPTVRSSALRRFAASSG